MEEAEKPQNIDNLKSPTSFLDETNEDEDENDNEYEFSNYEKRKKLKIQKKKNKQEAKSPSKGNSDKDICRFYKKGFCKHGFFGKNPVDGVNECPFLHPKVCPKLLNHGHGEGGGRSRRRGGATL